MAKLTISQQFRRSDIGQQAYEDRYQNRRPRSLEPSAKSLGFDLVASPVSE